ncbi:hypothetical protein HMSSN036_56770 [Paenibacillus macerans]|nr:hypothetical protein HMSSN036_56770 [Paenibacillus macerans]
MPLQLKSASGVPFRIVRCRRFCKHGKPSARSTLTFTGRIRPVVAGYSVGTSAASGTAGLIVSDKRSGGGRYILSNNHVLANNNTPRYSATLQPGGADGGRASKDRIGSLDRFVKLRKKSANYLDAATSKPLRRDLLKPAYAVFGAVPGYVVTYKIGDRFKKSGGPPGSSPAPSSRSIRISGSITAITATSGRSPSRTKASFAANARYRWPATPGPSG